MWWQCPYNSSTFINPSTYLGYVLPLPTYQLIFSVMNILPHTKLQGVFPKGIFFQSLSNLRWACGFLARRRWGTQLEDPIGDSQQYNSPSGTYTILHPKISQKLVNTCSSPSLVNVGDPKMRCLNMVKASNSQTTCWIFNFHPWIGIATGPLTWVKLPSALYVFHCNFQCQKSNLHKNNTVPWITWSFQWFHTSQSYIICLSTSSSEVFEALEVGSLSHRLGTRKLCEIVQHSLLTNYISHHIPWPGRPNLRSGQVHAILLLREGTMVFLGTQTCGTCKSTGICWHSFWTSRNWRYSLDSSTPWRWQKQWKQFLYLSLKMAKSGLVVVSAMVVFDVANKTEHATWSQLS